MNNNTNEFNEKTQCKNNQNQECKETESKYIEEKAFLEKEIESLKLIIEENNKNKSYLQADIENIKRHSKKEIDIAVKSEVKKIILKFLTVLDDYERSLIYIKKIDNTNLKDVLDGLTMTYNSFIKILHELNVQEIDASLPFNPEYHEAISTIQDQTKKADEIVEVVQKGFLYKNQLLRPAKVIIAK